MDRRAFYIAADAAVLGASVVDELKPGAHFECDGPLAVGSRGLHAFQDMACVFLLSPRDVPVWEVRLGRDVISVGVRSCSCVMEVVEKVCRSRVEEKLHDIGTISRPPDMVKFKKGQVVQYSTRYRGTTLTGYRKNGVAHRGRGRPAVEWADGKYGEWWYHGVRHRGGGLPAVEDEDYMEWWEDGVLQSFKVRLVIDSDDDD
jgi:hypothetical protein